MIPQNTADVMIKEPCIQIRSGVVAGVSGAFTDLTDYSQEDVLGLPTHRLFKELLRLCGYVDGLNWANDSASYIFTKHNKPREVFISAVRDDGLNLVTYIFQEMPHSRLDESPLAVKLLEDNHYAIGIYSVGNYVLLDANQSYIDIIRKTYEADESIIGKDINEMFPWWEGSISQRAFIAAEREGKTLYSRELEGPATGWDSIFTDNIIPIIVNGRTKFIISMMEDVTEKVETRRKYEEQLHTIKEQRDQLEAIIEGMSDALMIFDQDGLYTIQNKAARESFSPVYGYTERVGDGLRASTFYDENDQRIPAEDIPACRVRRGEKLSGFRMQIKGADKKVYTEVNGTPIYNKDGDFSAGILCCRDITEKVKNEAILREQNERLLQAEMEKNEALERAIDMKDGFLLTISHEFKTPLSVINSAVQALEMICGDAMPDVAKKYLGYIHQNSNRQLKLVNNLLDVTRMNAGRLKVETANLDIVQLTKSIIDSIRVFAEQKRIRISFTSTLDHKVIGIDKEKYERVLLNLLSNAVKFTPEGKPIAVRIYQKAARKRMVCVEVKDCGVGIPDDKQEIIFERFGQVSNHLTRQAEGTGIGLHLVKMMLELMGGEITLESKVGSGSTFTVLLPAHKAKEAPLEQVEMLDNRLVQATIEFSDVY